MMSSRAPGIRKEAKAVSAAALAQVRPTGAKESATRTAEYVRQSKVQSRATYWSALGLVLVDVFLVCCSGLLAYNIRYSFDWNDFRLFLQHPFQLHSEIEGAYLGFLLVYAALLIFAAAPQRLYRIIPGFSPVMESLLIGRAVIVATVILTMSIYLSGIKSVSRIVVGLTAVFSFVALSVWRLLQGQWARRRLSKGIGLRHAVIVGAGNVGNMLAAYLQANPTLGYEVRGFLDSNHREDPRVLGKVEDLSRIARQQFVDEIFVTVPSERDLVKKIALEAMRSGVGIKVIPEFYDGLAWQCPLEFVGEIPVRVLHQEPIPEFWLLLKRATDIIGSLIGLVVLLPVFLLIALAIKLDSRGPVFYRAHRVGKKGRRFSCCKFRTMVTNADEIKDDLRSRNERQGPFFKISNDPRITRVGRFLRRYSLDELPQLWNVLIGEMSLVGPRPHPVDDFKNYSLEHFRRLDVTPGITCLWQLDARHDPSFDKVLTLDSQYIENWSYLLDLRILLRTLPAVLRGTGS
jgi:exopolysaccharide biosynthesis polyprenyl glycosylphosphotransferase